MDDNQHCRFRLHPEAAYLHEVGYVFIDFRGRTLRMPEAEFQALRKRCSAGLSPKEVVSLREVLEECATAIEANESFRCQEVSLHED